MEIVKYIKVIVPRLSSTKKVLRNKLWHMLAGKKYRRVSVWGLSPASPPANFACHDAREPRQDELSGDGVRGGAPAENGFSVI